MDLFIYWAKSRICWQRSEIQICVTKIQEFFWYVAELRTQDFSWISIELFLLCSSIWEVVVQVIVYIVKMTIWIIL